MADVKSGVSVPSLDDATDLSIDETDATREGPAFDEIEVYSADKHVNVALASRFPIDLRPG